MPIAVYPPSLPKVPLLGYRETLADNLVRNEMEIGPPKTRPRSTAPRKQMVWTMNLTQTQKNTLVFFYETTLTFGSLEFQHQLPDDSGQQAIFKFSEPPQFNLTSPTTWSVTMTVEMLRLV